MVRDGSFQPVGLRRAGGRGGHQEHPGRRGPEAVQLQHHGGHEQLHRLGQQRHAGHGGRQLRPQMVVDQHSLAARWRWTPLASALPRKAASRAAEDRCYLRVHLRGSVHGRLQGVSGQRWRPPWRPAAPRWRRLCSRAWRPVTAPLRWPLLSTVDGLDTPLEVEPKIANVLLGPPSRSRYAGRAGNAQRAADTAVSAAQETAFEASTPRKVPVTPTWSLSTVDNITKWRPCPAGTGSQRRSVSLESWLAGRGRRVLLRVACPGLRPESRLRPEVQLRHSFGGTVKHMLAVRPVFRKEGHWDAPSVWQQDPWAQELPMAVTTLSAPPSCGKHTAICGQRLCVTCR